MFKVISQFYVVGRSRYLWLLWQRNWRDVRTMASTGCFLSLCSQSQQQRPHCTVTVYDIISSPNWPVARALFNLQEQDPAAMGEVVRQAAKDAMDRRYRLLPYLYSHFVSVSLIGGTVVKSLMEKFPMDLIARNIDKQFMWGDCLLVTPVLSPVSQWLIRSAYQTSHAVLT